MKNLTYEFDVATECPADKDIIDDAIIGAINAFFKTPEQVAAFQHHRLRIKVVVEDLGWHCD